MEQKYYKLDGTFMEYLNSIKYPTLNQLILEDIPWIQEKCTEIIYQNDYPQIVIFSLSVPTTQVYILKLNNMAINKLYHTFIEIIERVKENPLIDGNALNLEFPSIGYQDLIFGNYRTELNDIYWDGNQLATQRLFRNFNGDLEGKNYRVYGLTLIEKMDNYEINDINLNFFRIQNLKAENPELYNLLIENVQASYYTSQIINDYEQNGHVPSFVCDKIKNLLFNAFSYELWASMEMYEMNKAIIFGTDYDQHLMLTLDKGQCDHMKGLVKSFNDTDQWYLIDNDNVNLVYNIKSFFELERGFRFIGEMFWHEEESYGLKDNLKKFITPILRGGYAE
ncbi:hypothetical protein SNEBB_004147 [Seison nebaliae]|nr:hypothetical protein SNEBB_004147 [Seison nebaliae]